jgi:NitT/TauT family transport system substrate-binding protein
LKKDRRHLFTAAIAGLFAYGIGGDAFAQTMAANLPPVKITVIETTPNSQDIPFLAATVLAKDYNLEIDTVAVEGGGVAGQIFAGGTGDILIAGGDGYIGLNKLNPGQYKLVAAVSNYAGWSIATLPNSPIDNVASLAGKTIGVTGPGSSSEMMARVALRRAGLNPDRDVTIISLGSAPNLLTSLTNKRVDAVTLAGVALAFPIKDKTIKLIDASAGLPYLGDDMIARTKDIENRQPALLRFMKVYAAACKRMQTDNAFILSVMKIRYAKTLDDKKMQALADFSMTGNWAPLDGIITPEIYASSRKLWIDSGRFSDAEIPAYHDAVDNLVLGVAK